MKKIIPITLAALIGAASPAKGEDYIEHLSNAYNIPIEQLQALRGDIFSDLGLRGVIGEFAYDLRDSSFEKYMIQRFGTEGKDVSDFLNQGGTEEFGVSRDSSTGSIFLNRMIVTPDSVENRSLPLSAGTGNFMNQFALKIDSPLSAIHRIRQDGKEIEFEIVGGGDINYEIENAPRNILKSAIPGFKFMTEEEAEEFYSKSRILEGMVTVLTPENSERGNTLADSFGRGMENRLHVSYSVSDSQAVISIELREPGRAVNGASYLSKVPAIPETRLSYNVEQMGRLGLDQIVVAGASNLTNQVQEQTSSEIPAGKPKGTTAPRDSSDLAFRFFAGAGLPKQGMAGLGIRRNNFFIDLFGGYGPSNTHNEPHVTTGTTTPNGARIDFLTTTEQLEREIDLGLGVGGIYGNGVHVAFEPFYAIKKTQEIGDAIPRRYLNGELKGNDNAQPIYRDRVEKNIGVGLRVGKGRFSVHTRVKRKGGASLLLSITGEN